MVDLEVTMLLSLFLDRTDGCRFHVEFFAPGARDSRTERAQAVHGTNTLLTLFWAGARFLRRGTSFVKESLQLRDRDIFTTVTPREARGRRVVDRSISG